MLPSTTFTIKEALEEYRANNIIKTDANDIINHPHVSSHFRRPIDIAAVVLSATVECSKKLAVIVIGDTSLQSHECARMIFWGLPLVELHNMIQTNIVRGDIFRFNRVSVRDDYLYPSHCDGAENSSILGNNRAIPMSLDRECGYNKNDDEDGGDLREKELKNGASSSSTTPRKLFTVVCDFYHCWKEPEPGRSFSRIAKSSHSPHESHIKMEESSSYGNAMMSTPIQIVEGLARWFRDRDKSQSSMFGQSWSSSLKSLVDMDTTWKRRRLRDLRIPNIISDLVVYVLSVDAVAQNDARSSDQHQRQSRKRSWEGNDNWSYLSAFAVLSDTCHMESKEQHPHSMVFYFDESTSNFQTQIQRAYECNAKVLISQVLTQNCLSLFWCRGLSVDDDCGSLVLLPTAKTTICALEEDVKSCDASIATQYQSRKRHHELSMLTPCSETFSLETKFVEGNIISSDRLTAPSRTTIHLFKLISIHFNELGLSLPSRDGDKHVWPSEPNLASMLIRCTDGEFLNEAGILEATTLCNDDKLYEYRSAILTLSSIDRDLKKNRIRVKACSKIMSTLCGSCDAFSLLKEDSDGVEIALVSEILRGFINLDVSLEWAIYHNESNYEFDSIDSVYLPSLDF